MVLLLTIVLFIKLPDEGFLTFNSTGEFYQSDISEGPGEIEYNTFISHKIWSSNTGTPFSSFLKNDVDVDGTDEVIFGTSNGRIIVVSYALDRELLNVSVSNEPIMYCAVGDVDDDISSEIITTSLDNFIYILDFNTGKIQWKSRDYWQIHSLILLQDNRMENQNDIILIYNTSIVRIHDNSEVYNSPLDGLELALGITFSWTLVDVDMDNKLEIVIITRGFNPEFGTKGQQIWIFDVSSGDLEFYHMFEDIIFYSNPYPFIYNGAAHLAIGLFGDSYNDNLPDLFILNGFSKESDLIDVIEDPGIIRWRYIFSLEMDSNDLLLCTDDGDLISWSTEKHSIIWESNRITTNFIYQPPIICDIDSDGILELLIPTGQVVVVDTNTGEEETLLYIAKGGIGGRRLAVGDFDGDVFSEICFGHNETLYTQSYEIFFVDTPRIDIELNVSMIPTDRLFFAGKVHTIGFIITTISQSRIPPDLMILITNPSLGSIFNITIDTASTIYTEELSRYLQMNGMNSRFSDSKYYLEIQVIPNWSLSSDEFNNITIVFEDMLHRIQNRTFENCFKVERDLDFYGEFVIGCNRSILSNNDWIRNDEQIFISSFSIVYENTTSVTPPIDSFQLLLSINGGDSQFKVIRMEPYKILFYPHSSISFCNISLSIYQVPIQIIGSSYFNRSLRIDKDPPAFIQSFPENNTWFSTMNISVGIQVFDFESGFDISRIKYLITDDSSDVRNARWNLVDIQKVIHASEGYTIELEVIIPEGRSFFIWNVTDVLDNFIYLYQIIRVDITNIVFSNFVPDTWINTRNVVCNITVTDLNGSGVNGSSIQYSYTTGSIFNFTDWISTIIYVSSDSISISVEFPGVDGNSNRIRFRGRDVAGNEVLSSKLFSIRIDVTPPTIDITYPLDGDIISPFNRQIEIMLSENGSGLFEIIPSIIEMPANIPLELSYNLTSITETTYQVAIEWVGNSSRYSFSLRCKDVAGNIAQSEMIYFGVNQPPIIEIISPKNQSITFYGEDIKFQVSIQDPEKANYTIKWMLNDIVLISSEKEFLTNSLPIGNHRILVIVQDEYYIVAKEIDIDIKEKETTEYKIFDKIIILPFIIVGIILSYYSIKFLRKNRGSTV